METPSPCKTRTLRLHITIILVWKKKIFSDEMIENIFGVTAYSQLTFVFQNEYSYFQCTMYHDGYTGKSTETY